MDCWEGAEGEVKASPYHLVYLFKGLLRLLQLLRDPDRLNRR